MFKHAVGMVTDVIRACFEEAGIGRRRHRLVCAPSGQPPHHRRLGAKSSASPRDKVVLTVETHGNTSAASIPLALDVAVSDGRIKPGDLVMIEAMGGGFTWGAALIRW